MMSWLAFLDWMHQQIYGRRKPRPAKPFKSVQPVVESFESASSSPIRFGSSDDRAPSTAPTNSIRLRHCSGPR